MENLNTTSSKNLYKKSSERSWDVRVAEMTGNLNAALLYGQIAHHHQHMGEFSKSSQELSKELNFPLRTIERLKSLLIEEGFISIKIGSKNKTIYSNVKKLDYCKKSYRRYNANYVIINNDTNAGILLSYLIYCNKHFLKKGHDEFFKQNECIMKEIYLSQWQLNEAKKKLVKNEFIVTRIGHCGRTYYKINENKIEEQLSSAKTISADLIESAVYLEKTTINIQVNDSNVRTAKNTVLVPPKPRAPTRQNPERQPAKTKRIIYNKDIYNNYLTKAPNESGNIAHDAGLDSQLVKKENSRIEQPEIKPSHSKMHRKVSEVPSIGFVVPSIEKPQEQSVGLPKEDAGTKQPEKGLKKMEDSFEEFFDVKDNVEEMVDIWNETVGKDRAIYNSMALVLKEDMKKVLEEKCNNSLDLWKKYCTRLSLDDFRMGRKVGANGDYFNINLRWALNSIPDELESLLNLSNTTTKEGIKNITPTKDILIKEVFESSQEDWVKRLKVVLIDYMHHERSHDGLRSFQSYLKTATFEISQTDEKKELVIKAPYNGYIGLFIYSDLITKACQNFDKITIFDPSSRIGNSLCMERKATNVQEPSFVLKAICLEHGIEISALMQTEIEKENKKILMQIN